MFKKAYLLLILSLLFSFTAFSQYEDDALNSKPKDSFDSGIKPKWSQDLQPGIEFMVTANTGVFYAELSPFVGYRPVDPIMVGAGAHGSFLGAGNAGNYSYYGVHGFARIIIADAFFLHGEYRLLNGVVGANNFRSWVNSPIAGVGIMYGSQAYLLLGYATNVKFQEVNPFGGLVYRLGVYF